MIARRCLLALALATSAMGAAPVSAKPAAIAAGKLDPAPRTVIFTAFEPEWVALEGAVKAAKAYHINGLTILTGMMAGRPVVLLQSGVSMVNAAMNTQLVIDRFNVKRIVFSGIAGGDSGPNQSWVFGRLAARNAATVVQRFVAALPD